MNIYPWLPSVYYLKTRYPYWPDRVFYLAKFWGVLFLIFGSPNAWILLQLLPFYAVYDWFCAHNDAYPHASETKHNVRPYPIPTDRHFFMVKAIIALILLPLPWLYSGHWFPSGVLVFVAIIFHFHNSVPAKARILTFLILYCLKPIYLWFFLELPLGYAPLVVAVLFSASNWPQYALRRLGFNSNQFLIRILRLSLLYKLVILGSASLLAPHYRIALAVFTILTLAQWALRKWKGKDVLHYAS